MSNLLSQAQTASPRPQPSPSLRYFMCSSTTSYMIFAAANGSLSGSVLANQKLKGPATDRHQVIGLQKAAHAIRGACRERHVRLEVSGHFTPRHSKPNLERHGSLRIRTTP